MLTVFFLEAGARASSTGSEAGTSSSLASLGNSLSAGVPSSETTAFLLAVFFLGAGAGASSSVEGSPALLPSSLDFSVGASSTGSEAGTSSSLASLGNSLSAGVPSSETTAFLLAVFFLGAGAGASSSVEGSPALLPSSLGFSVSASSTGSEAIASFSTKGCAVPLSSSLGFSVGVPATSATCCICS